MTLAEYANALHQWCQELEAEALELYTKGVPGPKCLGLAISIVEVRRKQRAASTAALTVPRGITLPRV